MCFEKTINNKFTESMNWQQSGWLNINSTQRVESVFVYLYEMGHKSVNTLQEWRFGAKYLRSAGNIDGWLLSGTVDTFTYEYVNKPSHRRLELPQHWPFGKPVSAFINPLMKPRTDYKAHFWATTKTQT